MRLNTLYREEWLSAAAVELAVIFDDHGYHLPEKIRYAIGFPSTGKTGKAVGECWGAQHSRDGTHEIFVRIDQSDPVEILGILAHEIIHAVVGTEAKHGSLYKQCATAIGLTGRMTSTAPGPELHARLTAIADDLGPLPGAALDWSNRKKQTTRLLKALCNCGYTVRIARKWIEKVGAPCCPLHGPMEVDAG